MKKLFNGLLIISSLAMITSCTKVDNYPGPNAGLQGKLTDKTTGQPFQTESQGFQIELEELSYSATPVPQYIPTKDDGTYEDSQLFSGHYRLTPTQGPFWPVDPIQKDISGMTTQDFQLTPYLEINNLTHTLKDSTLTLTFNLSAPITTGMPNLLDVKPFVNITSIVGSGATISQYSDPNQVDINAPWSDAIAATTYTLTVTNLKSGRTFYVRVGARVDDSYKKYNYSQVIRIDVP